MYYVLVMRKKMPDNQDLKTLFVPYVPIVVYIS
jgi:hypothetical protein